MRAIRFWQLTLLVMMCVFVGCSETVPTTYPSSQTAQEKPHRFEKEIAAFEKQDLFSPPPEHPILFVGSSTIRIWKANEAFPGLPILNRGFGGSEISDVLYFFDRVVARYRPKIIVFYSGDNDLAAKKTPKRVVDDTHQFIDLVRQKLPGTKLVVISIKPSILRWGLIEQGREANAQIRQLVAAYPGGVFVDVESGILGDDGRPRAELFRIDGLHLSDKGYDVLNERVRPFLN